MMKRSKIIYILDMLLIGSVGVFVRYIPFTSAQIALVRGALRCLFIFCFGYLSRQKIRWEMLKENGKYLLFSGIALSLNWTLLFQAYKYTSIATATICYYFAPVLVILLAPLLFKERLNGYQAVCVFAAMLGMVFIVGNVGGGRNDVIGILYGLSAACMYCAVVLLNRCFKGISGVESSFAQLGISAVVIVPYVVFEGSFSFGDISGTAILLLLIVGVVHTGLFYLLYFSSLQILPSQTVALYSYMDPLSAIFYSALFLSEGISLLQLIGGALVLGATFANELAARRGCQLLAEEGDG